MLASFFGKSSPINYVLLSLAICLGYIIFYFKSNSWTFSLVNIGFSVLVLLLLIFMLLLVDFIIRKNDVTANSTFAIFIFTCFLLMIPSVYTTPKMILSATFLLLSTRRILSLKTGKNIEKKLLDAGVYITLASMFYFWALLFFVVLFIAILRLLDTTFRYLFIPFLSFSGVFIIITGFYLLKDDSILWMSRWIQERSFDFRAYNKLKVLLPLTMLLSVLLWMGVSRFSKIVSWSKKEKPTGVLILLIAVISVFISLLSEEKNGAELVFLIFPVSILTTNYIESVKTKERYVFNEILLWVFLLLAISIGIFM